MSTPVRKSEAKMPPKKLPPRTTQQRQQGQNAPRNKSENPSATPSSKPAIPEHEVKKSSSVSAQLALEAAKKAYDLRQAAYGAGDPNTREEILAKAINKEIEAESFGKAAKYTRSGAFQGLAAGAGLGVQPGVTIGKLTGALVGGVVSSVGALLGGGIGSAYGAISGPFWNLGEMASQGVRSIVGDFPNWESTPSQKKALEKMVMGAQQTKAPNQQELEYMRDDDGGASQAEFQQFTQDLTSWIPNMPSMPSIPSLSSLPGLGGQPKTKNPASAETKTASVARPRQSPPKAPTKPQASPKPKDTSSKATAQTTQPQQTQQTQKANEDAVKRKPKKLGPRSTDNISQPNQATVRKAPRKLETRQKAMTTNARPTA